MSAGSTRSERRERREPQGVHPVYRARHGLSDVAVGILERGRHAILGTINPDGSAHLAPLLYLHDGGHLYVATSASTRKARNVGARPTATVLVQDPAAGGEGWVSGSGAAELLRGTPARELGRRVRARYLTDLGEQELGRVMAIYDDIVIAVRPARWMTWDTEAYNAALAEHGVSLEHADGWFRS